MTAGSEQAERAEPRMSSEGTALAWLDALVGGTCTAEEFLAAVHNQVYGKADAAWEILSQLDQYYRRGKIKTDVFLMVKSRLEDSALDGDEDVTASLAATVAARLAANASPRSQASTQVTAPVTASQTKASPESRAAGRRSATPRTAASQSAPPRSAASQFAPSPSAAPQTAAPEFAPSRSAAPQAAAPEFAPSRSAAPQTAAPEFAPSRSAPPPSAAPQTAAHREIAIGDVLRNRYRVVGVLGYGGMGTVFEATDEYRVDLPTTNQHLAIKVLHSAVAHREELLAELQREFQHLQLLSHPNIVRVHEFDRDGDIAFFTMEFLNGALLSQVLSARKTIALARPYALAIMRDIGAALAHAHSRGIVHGDINPQNIFITNGGELRVLDFGASHKILRDGWTVGRESAREPVATPGYASCQLLEGQYPDARDDVFAFACVSYVLLAGKHPFPNCTAVEACAQGLRPARPPGITSHQWGVLREGLRWERDRRPADVGEWLDRFDLTGAARQLPKLPLIVNTPTTPKLNFKRVAAGILVAALLAAVGFWVISNYDSLEQQVTAWTSRARSAAEDARTLPAAPGPVAADQAPPPAAAAPPAPPVAASTTQTAPSTAAGAAPTQRANPALSALMAAPIPAAPSSTTARAGATPKPQPAMVARTSAADASARAANAGPARIELAADTVDVQAPDTTASIVVHRKGNLHGDASFTWWTESGTAKPGQDFSPVMPREGHIENGSASVSLSVPVSGTPRTKPKSFYVVIDRTDSGPALAGRTLTMVTLQPPD
jgi:serine/threonine protein kinase